MPPHGISRPTALQGADLVTWRGLQPASALQRRDSSRRVGSRRVSTQQAGVPAPRHSSPQPANPYGARCGRLSIALASSSFWKRSFTGSQCRCRLSFMAM